jgi:hypothetical protein
LFLAQNQNQYIKEMLNLPELQILKMLPMGADEVHIEVTNKNVRLVNPMNSSYAKGRITAYRQASSGVRKKVCLVVSTIQMHCLSCEVGFVWLYAVVGPIRRYSHLFRERTAEQALLPQTVQQMITNVRYRQNPLQIGNDLFHLKFNVFFMPDRFNLVIPLPYSPNA